MNKSNTVYNFFKLTKNRCRQIISSELVRVFSLTTVTTIVKMLTNIVSLKVIAVKIGPSGIALLGQLGNFSSLVMTVSTGGFLDGVTKYVSEFKNDLLKIKQIIDTSIITIFILSVLSSLFLLFFSNFLAFQLLHSNTFNIVFIIFGFTLFFYAFNQLFIAIINGLQRYKQYVIINIISSVVGLGFTIFLVEIWGVVGALVASISFQSIVFFITYMFVKKEPWNKINQILSNFDKAILIKLLKYSLISVLTILTASLTSIYIRTRIINGIGIQEAGLWDSVTKISGMYLLVITSSLAVYIMPKYSELQGYSELKREIIKTYKFLLPIVITSSIIIYFGKDIIIRLLFTPSFIKMRELFLFQLIGDVFKIFSWVLGYIFLAKAMTRKYIIAQFSYYIIYPALVLTFLPLWGVKGVVFGYMCSYFLFSILLIFLLRKLLFQKVTV
jgi:O-antigen/teichoic acid export membrane protein